jgi:serine phosphatase RsbU (regulator of sigma subunit)
MPLDAPKEAGMSNQRDYEGDQDVAEIRQGHSQEIPAIMIAWRVKTLNTVLTVVALLGFVSIIALFAGGSRDSNQLPVNVFFLTTYLMILALAFYRRLDWRLRGWGFLFILYLVGIVSLSRGGLAGAGREYLIIIPILATILIGVRAGMATAILSLLVMIAFSFLAEAGILRDWLIYLHNPVDLSSWAQEITYSAVLMGVSTSLLLLFNRRLLRMLVAERQASQALERAQARLEEYNQTLAEKVDQRTAELAQANKRMEQELALAGSIQTGFMARELPQITGWQQAASLIPARQTSGDFYDIYPLGKGRYGILVADVVDKGVGAALIMAFCWALVHTYASRHPDRPDLVMQKVDHRLFRDTHSGQFVTLFYGVLDTSRNVMHYCNAGHNPPYLFSAGKTLSVQSLGRTGVPLGASEGMSWKVGSVRFQPGDLLVLYTDGVTEAENACHAFFGSDRLIANVKENLGKSAREIHEMIIRGLCEFAGSLSQCDDITLMVLACELQTDEIPNNWKAGQ